MFATTSNKLLQMKNISSAQLARILGVDTKQVYTFHKRGKIVISKEGFTTLINVDDPVNRNFIMEQTNKKGNVVRVEDIVPDEILIKKIRDKTVTKSNEKEKRQKRKVVVRPISEYDIHRTAKIKTEAKITQLKFDQMNGKMIPFDQVKETYTAAFRNLYIEIYNIFDNEITILVAKCGGTREDLCKIRPKIRDMVNKAIERAEEKTQVDIKRIAKDFSIKRSYE
ncbi:hypothetical protein ES705_41171 [subsurface metagenome]